MRVLCIFCMTVLFMAAGCAGSPDKAAVPDLPQAMPVNPPEGSPMLTFNTFAGDALYTMLLLRMGSGGGIITTSFVDIHDIEKTSAFGRVTSQQVASRIGQYGFRIIEARLAAELSMISGPGGNAGEFMLSRETARLLSDTYDAAAVLVGCYSDYGNTVFVSARVVRLADNTVMAAYEYYVPRDSDVRLLLAGSGPGGAGGAGGGNAIWARHSAREQAFPPNMSGADSGADTFRSGNAGPRSSKSGAGGTSRVVPRAVLRDAAPAAESAAAPKSVAEKAPAAPLKQKEVSPAVTAAPVSPQPSSDPPVPVKDAPAPAGIPGGNI